VNKVELTFTQIENPPSLWCDSGHKAPETWGKDQKPIRFFRASGKANGIFCECCMIVANYISDQKRKENGI
jgi:hypothetical protein